MDQNWIVSALSEDNRQTVRFNLERFSKSLEFHLFRIMLVTSHLLDTLHNPLGNSILVIGTIIPVEKRRRRNKKERRIGNSKGLLSG